MTKAELRMKHPPSWAPKAQTPEAAQISCNILKIGKFETAGPTAWTFAALIGASNAHKARAELNIAE
jgi:hypothetical protein